MSSERFTANCKKCGAMFEYGLFSRNHPYCVNCAEELDNEALARIDETEASWTENWPTRATTSEVERHQGFFELAAIQVHFRKASLRIDTGVDKTETRRCALVIERHFERLVQNSLRVCAFSTADRRRRTAVLF